MNAAVVLIISLVVLAMGYIFYGHRPGQPPSGPRGPSRGRRHRGRGADRRHGLGNYSLFYEKCQYIFYIICKVCIIGNLKF